MPRLLLVDDNPAIRNLFGSLLQAEPDLARWELITVATGPEALEWTAQHTSDLIVLDYMMPDLNGIEVCAALRAAGYLRPIVLWSSADPDARYEDTAGLDLPVVEKDDIWTLLEFIRGQTSTTSRKPAPPASSTSARRRTVLRVHRRHGS